MGSLECERGQRCGKTSKISTDSGVKGHAACPNANTSTKCSIELLTTL